MLVMTTCWSQGGSLSALTYLHILCMRSYWWWCRSNARKAFKQNAWLHGLAFLMLFTVLSWLASSLLIAANHNVLAQCNGNLPGPRGEWPQLTDQRRLWSKTDAFKKSADWSMDWDWEDAADLEDEEDHYGHHHDNDDDDDGHHHEDSAETAKKPCKHKSRDKSGVCICLNSAYIHIYTDARFAKCA